MRKFIPLAITLFLLHTFEEAAFSFWKTDFTTIQISRILNLSPFTTYWIGQFVLYLFLMLLLLIPYFATRWTLGLLGLLLLLEFWHPIIALHSAHYEAGLISGTILGVFSIFYFVRFLKAQSKRTLE